MGASRPPIVRPASVKKAELIALLSASTTPVAVVVAPAGYGKTTLLGRWAEDDARPFAWVSLDERDDDVLVLLRDLATAIDRVEPLPESVFIALTGPNDTMWGRFPALGNALAGVKRSLVIALDDLHAVTNPDCHTILAALVDYVPPGSQIAITSRTEPRLPIPRWRARGMLVELGTSELRLDAVEAGRLLRGADVDLGSSEVAELTERTEGWPAGLYLAALSVKSGAPDLLHVKGFSGDDRYVSDYFRLEVLSRMPKKEASFVLRTSVLDTMTAALCDYVLETTGSARMLASLERANRFVVPLDKHGESYRYHHLFRQLLRVELERDDPGASVELNRRAATWYVDQGHVETAVRFAQAAGDKDLVAGLLTEVSHAMFYDGRMEAFESLLGWFKDDDLLHYPGHAVSKAWMSSMKGSGDEAVHFLAIAERGQSTIPLADGSYDAEGLLSTLRASLMKDGLPAALADAELAVDSFADDSVFLGDAYIGLGTSQYLVGSTDLARTSLVRGSDIAHTLRAVDSEIGMLAQLSLLEAGEGRWLEAARWAGKARDVIETRHVEHYALSALGYAAGIRVAMHQHRHAEARATMTRVHRLRPLLDHGLPWLTVEVAIELTRAHLALGEADAARAALADAHAVLRRRPDLGVLVDEVRQLDTRLASVSGPGGWAVSLTTAELRLLPYLATHLTFPEIATRLFLTAHTIRSEAKSIYRKLDANSRNEAIERAVEVGLLAPTFPHRVAAD